jgi:hypothetical protein
MSASLSLGVLASTPNLTCVAYEPKRRIVPRVNSERVLTPENSLPVPYELVTIDNPGMDFYTPGLEWAEPDLSVAASHMRLVVDDPALGEALGRRAKTDIERRHSIDAAGATMAARLRQLHGS